MIKKADEYRKLKQTNKKIQVKEYKVISQVKLSVEMQDNNINNLNRVIKDSMNV
jgi:hypothetical protein